MLHRQFWGGVGDCSSAALVSLVGVEGGPVIVSQGDICFVRMQMLGGSSGRLWISDLFDAVLVFIGSMVVL